MCSSDLQQNPSSLDGYCPKDQRFGGYKLAEHITGQVCMINLNADKGEPLELVKTHSGDLTSLRMLLLRYHYLETIPEELLDLSNLEYLDLRFNKLSAIPTQLGGLKKLAVLDLSNNRINHIPDDISQLSGLKRIVLFGNSLSEEEIGKIRKLLPTTEIL